MQSKIAQIRAEQNAATPERRSEIDGTLSAVLTGEHVLYLGPPGTGKSYLARNIANAFKGRYFEHLLTKFSTPEELFGPISLKALEQDRFARVITNKLPEAEFAFIDEIFKANSAILNSMLTLMNERVYHNDGSAIPCPLVTMVAASNELPDGKELEALFDRFVLRYDVNYLVRPTNFRTVLTSQNPAPSASITMADLKAAQTQRAAIKITDDTVDAVIAIRDAAKVEGIIASDRRWKKCLTLVQSAAYLAGETATCPEDCSILADSLWREPKERAKVAALVGKLADPIGTQARDILDAARETAQSVASPTGMERSAYISAAAKTLDTFKAQQQKLGELLKAAGSRAKTIVTDANAEIAQLHTELARKVTTGMGLGK